MERTRFIYIGMRITSDQKKSYCYREITPTAVINETLRFKTKLCRMEIVGTVVSAEVDGISFRKSKIEELMLNKEHPAYDLITDWSAEARAALEDTKVRIEATRDHPESLEGMIVRIREATSYMNRKQRASLALYIYQKLI